jgi:hypothetical protein
VKKDVDLSISRRKFLLGGALLGGAIAGGIAGSIIKPDKAHATLPGYLPKTTIDVNLVKKLAWRHFHKAGG